MVKKIIKKIVSPKIIEYLRMLFRSPRKIAQPYFKYDQERFLAFSGACLIESRERFLAQIIATYHVVEKGLTMPNRRFIFGVSVLESLMSQIDKFVFKYDKNDYFSKFVPD